MYSIPQQSQGYAVVQPQQIQSVPQQQQHYQYQQRIIQQQPYQQIPQQVAGFEPGQNQYYYYYGGCGQLTDISPTQQMIQDPNEGKMNYQGYCGTLASPKLIEDALLNEAPTSPALLYNTRTNTYSMPVRNIEISTEFYIATAFISMKITFENTSNSKVNTLFILPCTGTVTSTKVNINKGSRYLDTAFIDNDSAKQFEPKQAQNNDVKDPINTYIPNVFRFPIADIAKNEIVSVEVDWMESLEFVESRYHFYIPLNFGNGILPNTHNINNINIQCSINCLTPGIQYGSTTHNLILTEQENLKCKLIAQPKHLANNRDFHLFYSVQTNAISAALLCDTGSQYEYDPLKSLVVSINPPTKINGIFQRDIIFLLDRSGSMTGKPFADAVRGLIFALNTLTQNDRFCIIAFDHEQIVFNPTMENNAFENNNFQLFQAFPNTIQQAIHFLNNITARGTTDIKTPLMQSINYLNNNVSNNNIPFIVLLTDGAVEQEKEIVQSLSNLNNNKTRVLTFGIGRYCNEYFLKMLALTTRGWNDGCIYPKDLYPKIRLMMDKAKAPILTDIELEIPSHLTNVDIYPKTIPDLFMNGPIIISGKYSGEMPQQIILKGTLQNGAILAIPIRSDVSDIIPINKIFIKQRMDQLNAQYWLNNNQEIKKQIIDISINERFPSPYTSMVAYQLTAKEKKEQDKNNNNNKKKKGSGLSGGQIAALAGGAVVIGSGIFLLGNISATMGNLNIIDGISGGFGNIGDIFGNIDCPCDPCMDIISCGNCDCGMIAKISSCGICANCDNCLDVIPCADCNGGCIELPGCGGIGDVCESCGGCFGFVGDSCGNLCECIPDCVGEISGLCGNIGEIFGGLCECIGEIAGSLCESFEV